MSNSDQENDSKFIYEEELTLSEEDLNDVLYYCKACDAPLKNYNSIVCFDCLSDSANLFSDMISNHLEPKTIFIDLDFKPLVEDDDEETEESIENEWDEDDEDDDDDDLNDEDDGNEEEYEFS